MDIPARRLWLAPLLLAGSVNAATDASGLRRIENARLQDSAELKSALLSPAASLRARAARAMGRIQSPAYLPALTSALRDPDASVRAEAAFAAGQVAVSASAAAALKESLTGLLQDPDPQARCAAIEALGKSGDADSERRLAALLRDPDDRARREAALALFRLRRHGRIPAYARGTIEALLDGLRGPPASRWACAHAFSRWPEPRAREALETAAKDPDQWTRLFSLRALARLGRQARCASGLFALADPDERVRVEAVIELKACGGADRLVPKAVGDPSLHVRAAAAAALAEPEGALSSLRRLALDPSPTVRAQAVSSLAQRLKEAARPDLRRALSDSSWWVRSRAAFSARHLPKSGPRLLQGLLKDDDLRVRAAALDGLVAGGFPEAARLAAEILEDPASPLEVRDTAMRAAAQLRSRELIVPVLSAYLNSFQREYAAVRESAVDAAAALAQAHPGSEELRKLRRMLLRDSAPFVREKAARLFGRAGADPLPYVPSPVPDAPPAARGPVAFQTSKGRIVIELAAEQAPAHAASLLALVRRGFYDGLQWHRVVSNLLVQGGTPAAAAGATPATSCATRSTPCAWSAGAWACRRRTRTRAAASFSS